MASDHRVIDLDEHHERSTEPDGSPRRRRTPFERPAVAYLVGAFVLGAALGGVGVSELQGSRQRQAEASTVALVAFAGSSTGSGGNSDGIAQFGAQLTVINTGPQPITVRAVGAELPGVAVDATDQSRRLRAGGTGWIDVQVTVRCAVDLTPEPLPMRLSVETADQRVREISHPVALIGSSWHDLAMLLCDHAPPGHK